MYGIVLALSTHWGRRNQDAWLMKTIMSPCRRHSAQCHLRSHSRKYPNCWGTNNPSLEFTL